MNGKWFCLVEKRLAGLVRRFFCPFGSMCIGVVLCQIFFERNQSNMDKKKIIRYLGLSVFAIWIFALLYLLFRDVKSTSTESEADTLTAYIENLETDQEIQILKDSITNLTHEKIILQEKLALASNDNYELRARIWSINEYIRTGRFPHDSTVRRKFPRHHGQPNPVRIRQNSSGDVFKNQPGMPETHKAKQQQSDPTGRTIEKLPGDWRSLSKTGAAMGKTICEGIEGKVGLPSGACNRCFFRPSIGYASTLILVS